MDIIGDYKIYRNKLLGSGAFANVFEGENVKTKEIVAIKEINLEKTTPRMLYYFNQEKIIMEKLGNHPNIVKFLYCQVIY